MKAKSHNKKSTETSIKDIEISDFIKSLHLCKSGTVPADVRALDCRIEDKYLKNTGL